MYQRHTSGVSGASRTDRFEQIAVDNQLRRIHCPQQGSDFCDESLATTLQRGAIQHWRYAVCRIRQAELTRSLDSIRTLIESAVQDIDPCLTSDRGSMDLRSLTACCRPATTETTCRFTA